MHTQRCYPWLIVCWTILALSWGMPLAEAHAQGGRAESAASATADEGGGTCNGCLDEAAPQGDISVNREFLTGIKANARDADGPIPTPSAAVFSLAILAIAAAAFFVRRWFAMTV